ncbi:hypothetical protein D9M68_19150 [compost metagenome]
METTYISKTEGPTSVWVTDDVDKVRQLMKSCPPMCHHKVILKGHEFSLFIQSSEHFDRLKDDPGAAVEFAKEFMTSDSNELMDWARILLL